jgi:hypothetical protein
MNDAGSERLSRKIEAIGKTARCGMKMLGTATATTVGAAHPNSRDRRTE